MAGTLTNLLARHSEDRRVLYRAGNTGPAFRLHIAQKHLDVEGGTTPFPDLTFPDAKDKRVILSYTLCNHTIAYQHHRIKDMPKDISRFSAAKALACNNADRTIAISSEVDDGTARVKNARLIISPMRADCLPGPTSFLRVALVINE